MSAVHKPEPLCCELPLGTVDLWFVRLGPADFSLHAVLSADEIRRAFSFRCHEHVTRFIARRGVLRLILAAYTEVSARALAFTYSRLGKPSLERPCELRFSMSHSDGMGVYAITRERDVGIDVERLCDAPTEFPHIAQTYFSSREIELLNASPADRKSEIFLCLWTQFEAKAKACGSGIADPIRGWDSFSGRCFSLIRSDPIPGYIVGLAVQGQEPCTLRIHEFDVPCAASLAETRLQNCLPTVS